MARFAVKIIFTGGSVRTCLPFLRSLIEITKLPLQLVANGCQRHEERLLEQLCNASDRINFFSLGSATVLEHGVALDRLLTREASEFFTVMDSDVFATKPISASDIQPPRGEVALTACLPIWHTERDTVMPESFQVMGGRFTSSENGYFLGCSYLASYRTDALRRIVESENLSFRRYTSDELPRNIKTELNELGLRKKVYDTAKVMNILLQKRAGKMSYRDIDGLVHIGGISADVAPSHIDTTAVKQIIKSMLPQKVITLNIRRRYACSQAEAENLSDLFDRRVRARKLVAELAAGPPYSSTTQAQLQSTPAAREVERVFRNFGSAANGAGSPAD